MKNLFSVFCISLALAACQPSSETAEQSEPPHSDITDNGQSAFSSIGQSWSSIDDNDLRSEWRRIEASSKADFAHFGMTYSDAKGVSHTAELHVSIQPTDRVLVARKNSDGSACDYEGRIWTETDLDSYEAFSEDSNPDNRQAFYRIISGTYRCNPAGKSGSWLAKINE